MKYQNILSIAFGLFSIASAQEISSYFNCKDEARCHYLCNKAVRDCWNNHEKSKNECWNLSAACNSIDSGVVPEEKAYEPEKPYIKLDLNDPKTPVGIKIPSDLAFYLTQPAPGDTYSKMNAGRACFNSYYSKNLENNGCGIDNQEVMSEVITVDGNKITRGEYCTIFAEVCANIDIYTKPLTEETFNFERYFNCKEEDYCENQCRQALAMCDDDYPKEDCEKLSIVCDSIKSGVMPSFTTTNTTTTEEPTPTPAKKYTCISEFLGYPCCEPGNTRVYYIDGNGEWGYDFKQKEWCGLSVYDIEEEEECWAEYLGYPCCVGCKVYETDEDGKWGYENGHWCGILSSHCKRN